VAGQGLHVTVVGNEKGGSGKSTTAFHLAIFLLHQGFMSARQEYRCLVAALNLPISQKVAARKALEASRSAGDAPHFVHMADGD
jgi:Mrp family chromosome partitioning ATPase